MRDRIISSIVMIIIAVPFLLIGGNPFAFFMLIVGEMAMYELLKLTLINQKIKTISYIFLSIIILKDLIGINFEHIIIFTFLFYLLNLIIINDKKEYNYKDAFYLIAMTLFIGIIFSNVIAIRNDNLMILLYLLLITVTTDTMAFFTGLLIGKHKLAPAISPNKTVEGFIGGTTIGSIISSIFYISFVKYGSNIGLVIMTTTLLSMIGQIGDLVMSSIKRQENIKDFSNLIPGHGGIMDRFDSIIFVVCVYLLIKDLF